jgi:hypothetical protein
MRNKFQFAATPAVTLLFVLALTGFECTLIKQERRQPERVLLQLWGRADTLTILRRKLYQVTKLRILPLTWRAHVNMLINHLVP